VWVSKSIYLSVGVQVDLPLFSSKRQDANVSASAARLGVTSTQRRLEVRRLAALAKAREAELVSLSARQQLFDTALLEQSESLAESALNTYIADKGTFDGVMRARILYISAKLDALALHVDIAKTLAELAYLYYPLTNEQNQLTVSRLKDRFLDTHISSSHVHTPSSAQFGYGQFGYGHPLQSSESNNESLLTRVETKVDIHTNSNMDTHKITTDGAAKQ
jgi:hypothetical protein